MNEKHPPPLVITLLQQYLAASDRPAFLCTLTDDQLIELTGDVGRIMCDIAFTARDIAAGNKPPQEGTQ